MTAQDLHGTPAGASSTAAYDAAVEPVIAGRGVAKHWNGKPALVDATFVVEPGITGLLGANGAGKTTLFGMILGLHRPTAGELRVLGLDPARVGPAVRARVGYSPEYHVLPEDMRAHDLVRHIGEVHGLPHRDATARASDALWQVGLGEERFRPVGTMSTGQRQRVKLAQAIVHDPALVLLDEPTDGLDPVQRDDMLALIRRVGTEFGINVVLSSHLLEEVERVCDSAVILFNGMVVAADRIDRLTHRTESLVIDVTDRELALDEDLRARGVLTAREGQRITVWAAPPAQLDLHDVVRDALVTSGAGVRRMGAQRVTLEDVFLEVGTGVDTRGTDLGARVDRAALTHGAMDTAMDAAFDAALPPAPPARPVPPAPPQPSTGEHA